MEGAGATSSPVVLQVASEMGPAWGPLGSCFSDPRLLEPLAPFQVWFSTFSQTWGLLHIFLINPPPFFFYLKWSSCPLLSTKNFGSYNGWRPSTCYYEESHICSHSRPHSPSPLQQGDTEDTCHVPDMIPFPGLPSLLGEVTLSLRP